MMIRTHIAMLAATLILLASGSALAQRGPSFVEVTPVIDRQVATGQTVVGTVTPTQRAVIGSAVDGRVVEFLVEEGDRVESGEALAQLLTDTISLDLEAAEAELELRRQQQAELENGSRPEEIEQARSRMKAAEALVEFLVAERQRQQELVDKRAASASQYEQAISLAMEAQEKLIETKASYQLAVDGPRIEQIAQARAQTARQDAIVRRLKDQIKKHTVISRFAGYVTAEHTEEGQWVTRGDPVAEVVALDEVDIVAKVVEESIPYIRQGGSVRVEVPALPQQTFTGIVVAIVPQADVRSRTFPVKVRVRNQVVDGQPQLKAGMLARVTLPAGEEQQALLVPKDALVLGGRSPQIWIVDKDSVQPGEGGMRQGHAVPIPVQLGVADGDLIQVQGEVSAGALVVIKGNERIPPPRPNLPSRIMWTGAPKVSQNEASTGGGTHGAD